jgi:zinc transporter ZupT
VTQEMLAVGLTALAGLSSLLGGLLALVRKHAPPGYAESTLAAVAGFLLAAAFLDLIPEVAEESPAALAFVFGGYLLVYLAESLVPSHAHAGAHLRSGPRLPQQAGLAAMLGLALHSYFDGVALAAGTMTDTGTGILLLVAISIHQLPVGFGLATIMRAAGYERWSSLMATAALLAATVAGGVSAVAFSAAHPGMEAATLAFAAGTFIYIGATDMIPASHEGGSAWSVLYSLAGAGVFVATSRLLHLTGL